MRIDEMLFLYWCVVLKRSKLVLRWWRWDVLWWISIWWLRLGRKVFIFACVCICFMCCVLIRCCCVWVWIVCKWVCVVCMVSCKVLLCECLLVKLCCRFELRMCTRIRLSRRFVVLSISFWVVKRLLSLSSGVLWSIFVMIIWSGRIKVVLSRMVLTRRSFNITVRSRLSRRVNFFLMWFVGIRLFFKWIKFLEVWVF